MSSIVLSPGSSTVTRLLSGTNKEQQAALSTVIPTLSAQVEALGIVSKARAEQSAATRAAAEAWQDLINDLAKGCMAGRLPDDYADRSHRTATQEASAITAAKAVIAVENEIVSTIDTEIRDAEDRLFQHLDAEIRQVVAEARAIPLEQIDDAEAAIEAGKAAAWEQYAQLRARNYWLRDAQQAFTMAFGHDTATLETFGWLSNYTDLWPDWFNYRSNDHGFELGTRAPWPDSPAGRFRWSVGNHEAKVWVPTWTELETAAAEASAQVRRLKQEQLEPVFLERREALTYRRGGMTGV